MFEKSVLPGGISILTERLDHVPSVSLGIWVRGGSRHEPENLCGITHFIEHMLFKGTEKRTPFMISSEIESVGGVLNAFTSKEYTFFYSKVLKEHLPLAADILIDIFTSSTFDGDELEREKQVVNQEILMIEDNPEDYVHDFLFEKFYPLSPLGRPVQGYSQTVLSLNREEVVRYFSETFSKLGVMVVAVGNLHHQEVVDLFAPALSGERFREKPPRSERPRANRGVFVSQRDIEQVHLCVAFPAPSKKDPARRAAKVLRTIAGGGMSSRLFQEVREKRGLAYSIHSSLSTFSDAGMFRVYGGTTPEKVPELLQVTLSVLREMRDGGITDEELSRGKEQLKGHLLLNYESTDYRLIQLATNEMYYGKYMTPEEIAREIDLVEKKDLMSYMEEHFREEELVVAAVGAVDAKDLSVGQVL